MGSGPLSCPDCEITYDVCTTLTGSFQTSWTGWTCGFLVINTCNTMACTKLLNSWRVGNKVYCQQIQCIFN